MAPGTLSKIFNTNITRQRTKETPDLIKDSPNPRDRSFSKTLIRLNPILQECIETLHGLELLLRLDIKVDVGPIT